MARLMPLAVWLILICSTGASAIPALEPLITGLNQPVLLTHPRDGSQRRFIVEQPGRVLVMQPGATVASVFLDIRHRVLSGGEQGLLGLAFHPRYSENGRFFVNYTRQTDGATVIAEYRVLPGNANVADADSELIHLLIPHPFANHNGGMIEFGPDNFLYIATGDGGAGNDPNNRAQNVDDLLGKILRIDIDHFQSETVPYSSPQSNPYFGSIAGRDEIFAIGFRNPWRFSFDRLTGQLFAGDVGQNAREEIDLVVRGGNYGWRVFEGTRCTGLGPASCASLNSIPPITEYNTTEFGRCAVTGGYVYRGARQSVSFGTYLFGDYCSGEVFVMDGGARSLLFDTDALISSFGEDEAGEIYLVDHRGSISRIANASIGSTPLQSFSIPGRGGVFLSASAGGPLSTGYTRLQAGSGDALPGARAILKWREHGVLVSELSISATGVVQTGRILAVEGDLERTGVGITNPNSFPVTVDFNFTDANGQDFGFGAFTLEANHQISRFLDEAPFNSGRALQGTFTFRAGAPIAFMAIRSFYSARSDFLMSGLPVPRVNTAPLTSSVFPHWMLGAGWTSEFILVNPSEVLSTGQLVLAGPAGEILETLSYSIPTRSSRRLIPALTSPTRLTGSARLIVNGGTMPSGAVLLRFSNEQGIAVETMDPAITPGLSFRGYAELTDVARTALAVANTTGQVTSVTVELRSLTGALVGTAHFDLPSLGQKFALLDELPGLQAASPFQGSIQVSSLTPIAVTLMRTRTNSRGDTVISSIPPDNLADVDFNAESFFPLFALGGGAEMEFVLLNSQLSGLQAGGVQFLTSDGRQFSIGR